MYLTHGLHSHPLYDTWYGMLQRCENPGHRHYPDYGGRGIRVCDRWHDPAVFIADLERWLGPRPQGCTLDRIQNDHDYRQDNVQWATPAEQAAHRRPAPPRKLTRAQRAEIPARHAAGALQQELAAEYGISQARVSQLVRACRLDHGKQV